MTAYDHARLKSLAVESGVPYRAIASAIGSNEKNVSNILNGRTTPRADTLAAILEAIGGGWGDLDGAKKGRNS